MGALPRLRVAYARLRPPVSFACIARKLLLGAYQSSICCLAACRGGSSETGGAASVSVLLVQVECLFLARKAPPQARKRAVRKALGSAQYSGRAAIQCAISGGQVFGSSGAGIYKQPVSRKLFIFL